jgi:protein-disulfide isomerase
MSKQSYVAIFAVLAVLIGLFAWLSHSQDIQDTDNSTGQTGQPAGTSQRMHLDINPDQLNANWNLLLSAADGPPQGNPKAPYTMIDVGDFQCPQCGRSKPLVDEFIEASGGRVKMYFVNFPLIHIHPHALFAAEAALAASEQGKFWPMYDLLYAHQDELIPSIIEYYAEQDIPGFNAARYDAALASPRLQKVCEAQTQLVLSLKIISTPTFIIRKTAGGTPSWYVGSKDSPGVSLGFRHLAASPPWLSDGK